LYPFILPQLPDYMEFNLDDWPDDGTDWDGVHDPAMKIILDNKAKLEIIEKYAQKLIYMQPAISWQLKQIIRNEPRAEPPKPKPKVEVVSHPNSVTYIVSCSKCDFEQVHVEKSLEVIKKFHEDWNQKWGLAKMICVHDYQYKLVEQGSS